METKTHKSMCERFCLVGIVVIGVLVNSVSADDLGQLVIFNIINNSEPACNFVHGLADAQEGLDTTDGYPHLWPPGPGYPSIFSDVEGTYCYLDSRPATSTSFGNIKLFYWGTVSNPLENRLEVMFPYAGYEFGLKPITLELQNGKRYDIREAISNGSGTGTIALDDLETGSYSNSVPYTIIVLHFRYLADLDNNGKVDLTDFSVLSNNWLGSGLGDISGPDGLPDGIVDIYDLLKMVDQWLQETGQ